MSGYVGRDPNSDAGMVDILSEQRDKDQAVVIYKNLEKTLGENARIWPKDRDLKVGDVIPAASSSIDKLPITHLVIGGNVYTSLPLPQGVVTAINENYATIGGNKVTLGAIDALKIKSIPPAIPPASSNFKLIMRPFIKGTKDYGFYIVSRKSRSKSGYIATLISNDVAKSDAFNVGGDSNFRPSSVMNILECYLACCRVVGKSSGVALSGLPSDTINSFWDYSDLGVGTEYHSKSSTHEIETRNREVYTVPKNLDPNTFEYIEYAVSGDCTLRLGLTPASTPECEVLVGFQGSMYKYAQISLLKDPASPVSYLDLKIEAPSMNYQYRIRVINKWKGTNGNNCYVVGLNICKLSSVESKIDITSALIQQPLSYNGAEDAYRRSRGANEFAAKESKGKWFGTYHGGHSNFVEVLRVDSGSDYDLRSAEGAPDLLMTEHVTLHSQSTLVPASGKGSYTYVAESFFYDGFDYTQYSINNNSGYPSEVSDLYTHMCTTNNTFNTLYQPILHVSSEDQEIPYGNEQTCYQYREDGLSLVSYYSGVDMLHNLVYAGGRISYQSNYAKQYYGAILGTTRLFTGGTFVTAKEYF